MKKRTVHFLIIWTVLTGLILGLPSGRRSTMAYADSLPTAETDLDSGIGWTEPTDPSWLLLPPDGMSWQAVALILDELEDYRLLEGVTRWPDSRVIGVAWLSAPARQRLIDMGLILLPDTDVYRRQLGLALDSTTCHPESAPAEHLTHDIPSFAIDITQDYVEGYIEPDATISVTLYSPNNGIKGREQYKTYSSGQYRLCFEEVNLLPGDRLAVEIEGLAPRSFSVPTLTVELDSETDQVWGLAPPNTVVSVEVQSPDFSSSVLTTTASTQGEYTVSFGGVQDLAEGTWVQATVQGDQEEIYRISRFWPSRLNVAHDGAINIDTAGGVPARLTVREAGGALRDTIEGLTNRIGDVCQSVEGLVPGDLVQVEVEGVTTSIRTPTFLAELGETHVTGTTEANAEITCSVWDGNYSTTTTTSDAQGTFDCDFSGVHTLARSDRVSVTAIQGGRSASSRGYVPVSLSVSPIYDRGWGYTLSGLIQAYTRPNVPVTLVVRDAGGTPYLTDSVNSDREGGLQYYAETTFRPGDVVQVTSEGQTATVQVPDVFFDPATDVISGTAEPQAQVSVRINGGSEYTTTVAADGSFSLTIPGDGFTPGDSVSLEVTDDTGASVSMSGYVPVKLSFRYSSGSIATWPTLPGRWQILTRSGGVRAEEVFTATPSLASQAIYPGDLISVTTQGLTATLRIPLVEADLAADTLTGLVQPGAEVDLTVSGLGGETVTRTLIAAPDGTFSANFVTDHDLVPGDAVRIVSGATDVTYYLPARVRIYQEDGYDSVYVYTAPLTPTQVIVRNAASQIAFSETLTSNSGGGAYFYLDGGLPDGGTVEVQTAGYALSYPFQPLVGWVDRENDRLVGNGPPNASLTIDLSWGEQVMVQTDGDGSFVLDLAGQGDLDASTSLPIHYLSAVGVEQTYTAYGPSLAVDVAANTVSGSHLPPETAIRLRGTAGTVKETRTTPAGTSYFSVSFADIAPGDTVEVDYPTGVIVIPVTNLAATLDKENDAIVLSGPPGAGGGLYLNHDGVRRNEGYGSGSLAPGDDGTLVLPLQGIYDIWDNTMLTYRLDGTEGDGVYTTLGAPGLTANPTFDSVSGYATPGELVTAAIKRGSLTRGSAQVRADETGAFTIQGFCQAGSPVDLTTGDRLALDDEAASVDVIGVSAGLDTDTDMLTGAGPVRDSLRVRFYSTQSYLVRRGGAGGGPGTPGSCHIPCRALRSDPDSDSLSLGVLVKTDESGHFAVSADQDLVPGDYAIITYEDDDGDLLQYVVHSTDGSGLQVTTGSLPGSVDAGQILTVTWTVSGGVHYDAARLYWDTESHACDRNYANMVEIPSIPVDDGGSGGGGGSGVLRALAAISSTHTITLSVPNSGGVLYLRPYAGIDGYRVWANEERSVLINPPPPGEDEYEPDDTCAQATPIPTDGTVQQHTFHDAGDADWVVFHALAGATYILQGSNVGPQVDLVYELHNTCTEPPLGGDDLDLGQGFRLVWTCPADGDYYLKVADHDPTLYGDDAHYDLSVRQQSTDGVAILVAGHRDVPESLMPSFTYVADMAYRTFRAAGYTPDRIYYLHPDLSTDADDDGVPDVDAVSNSANLQQAITTWAASRVGPGVPLYLYLVDHGSDDLFYIDTWDGTVTAADLDGWLTQLESATGCDNVNVIFESCESGSFIIPPDQLSRSGRVIITAAKDHQTAYGLENGEGAYFSNTFLAQLGTGADLWTAYDLTRDYLWELRELLNYQTPWLDDNGDGVANEQDGAVAQQRGLLASFGSAVPWIAAISPAQQVDGATAVLTATIYDDGSLTQVWAEVYPPSYQPPDDSDSVQIINVPRIDLERIGEHGYRASYDEFTEIGEYRVVIYARDEEGNHALPRLTTVRTGWAVYLPLVIKR